MKASAKKNFLVLLGFALACSSCEYSEKTGQSFEMNLNKDWSIQSEKEIEGQPEQLSSVDYSTEGWYHGDIPATVMTILRKNKDYGDLFMGKNLEKISGEQFKNPWWYRKVFDLDDYSKDTIYRIVFEGINYKANIWLNGQPIAKSQQVEGPFSTWELDVNKAIKKGKNILLVEIIPPQKGDLTIGFVDWNPEAPDLNMGLWRGVKLLTTGSVSLKSPFVVSSVDTATLKSAKLEVKSFIQNHTDQPREAKVSFTIEGIGTFDQTVHLGSNETKEVVFDADKYKKLNVSNPRLWWPNNLGSPELYTMNMAVSVDNQVSDSQNSRFGIRQIEQFVNEKGWKGYKINGKKLIIKGAGWVDDMMLSDSDEKVKAQVDYARQMNLNCIRLEGFWGKNQTLYNAADENGMLVMVGWSCQWEWEEYCGRPATDFMSITEAPEIERHSLSFRDQVLTLRNHPSVFLWVLGSDKLPIPALEKKVTDYINNADGSRPVLASCKLHQSDVSGSSGVKMFGPYGYVPPIYWYIDTIAGGAYGFNTETGPGPQVPPIESIRKMIPEDKLWPINEMWDYHSGRNEFKSLDRYLKAFNARYGKASNVEEFAFKSQLSNYEAIRPMFEAFQVNRYKSTGVIQWMLNSAWPEMFWQLYDYYLMPNGAFYGTKKGCQPLNPVYNYKDKSIYLVNDYYQNMKDITLKIKLLNASSEVLLDKQIPVSPKGNSAEKIFALPEIKGLSGTYFINLELTDDKGKEIATNFYWLSTKPDVLDFAKTTWVYTPASEFADFSALNSLPKVKIEKQVSTVNEGDYTVFNCKLNNPGSALAFFIELAIKDKKTGETILPALWSDNYVSVLPGSEKNLQCRIKRDILAGKETEVTIKGFNLSE